MATNSDLRRVADNLRVLSASMVEKAKSGHPGGAMGGADFMAVLYGEFLRYDPSRMDYPYRDRFFLDPGHMSPLLYATLALAGYYSPEDLQSLRQWGSVTPGHPEVDVLRGVENTSGPLGQGHAMALAAGQPLTIALGGTYSLMVIFPLVIVYVFTQRFLTQGIERSGIVG